jgi:hypothetical protein
MEKGTVQVINVSADILHAYTPFTSLSEYLQYLLVVCHLKKGWQAFVASSPFMLSSN